MGYLHIENLYKCRDILLFKECYALEKIHGTSAHLMWNKNKLSTQSGGASHTAFMSLFDLEWLTEQMLTMFPDKKAVIYGEAYGGKEQGMSATYGKQLKFVVFDVQVDELWLSVPQAEQITKDLGLEFVYYEVVPANPGAIDFCRDWKSHQAERNGMGVDKKQEGVVLRPLIELTKNNGERVIAKHKHDDFKETTTSRELSVEQLQVLAAADAIAEEWVTEMRLAHVLDKVQPKGIEDTGMVIKAVIEDVLREAKGEIIESKEAQRAIGKRAATLYKARVQSIPRGAHGE